jgi:hypothetical protein
MTFDAPSEDAIELWRVALRAIALAGVYSAEDVGYAIGRLRHEQSRISRDDNEWQAYDRMCDALMLAAME